MAQPLAPRPETGDPGGHPAAGVAAGAGRLRALFDEQYDFCWRTLRRLGVPEASVDDAAQEVFVVLTRKIAKIQPGSERAFLFRTALRIASQARRTRSRRRDAPAFGTEIASAVDPAPGVDEQLDERRAREQLDRVLEAMPLDLRTVFILSDLDELTMAGIAEYLSIPAGTVASRLRRAREVFRKKAKDLMAGGAAAERAKP